MHGRFILAFYFNVEGRQMVMCLSSAESFDYINKVHG